MLENSVGKADDIYGKIDQVVLQKCVLKGIWDGRGGGVYAPVVHI